MSARPVQPGGVGATVYIEPVTLQPTLPDWVAPSSPGHNRPLVPRVERLARTVRASAAQVARRAQVPFESLYRPSRSGLGFTLADGDVPLRAAWAVLGEWLVAASVQEPCAKEGLEAAHKWFWHGSGRALGHVGDVDVPLEVDRAPELRALMPYLLDPVAAATRRDVLSAHSTVQERRARKAAGVYYTPGDVAHSMVQRLVARQADAAKGLWLDPAHGSGVFLRAAFCAMGGTPEAADHIYGVDLDPFAGEAASFVLTAEDLIHNPDGPAPWVRWHRFRNNLATGDALLIDAAGSCGESTLPLDVLDGVADGQPLGSYEPWRLETVFPETAGGGFARVIANPPYAPLKRSASSVHLSALHPVTGRATASDVSPAFVELSVNLLSNDGALAVVLPLSIVSSTRPPFPELRSYLAKQQGALEFLSFDRVPDALFGDDIKTRNAIVFLDRNSPSDIVASPLHRWTSRTRATLGRDIPVVSVVDVGGVPDTIPKIGTEWERELLQRCSESPHVLDQWVRTQRQSSLDRTHQTPDVLHTSTVALAPTAYNFLGVVRDPHQAVQQGHDSQNPFSILNFHSAEDASAAYALLSSRLAFWMWHITGDGFHVTGALRRRLPAPPLGDGRIQRLASLGDMLWQATRQNPLVSMNRGRTTVSYPTWSYAELVDEIDAELGHLVGVQYSSRLAAWHEKLVVVDPDSERRNLIRKKIS